MEQFKKILTELQSDTIKVLQSLSKAIMSKSISDKSLSRNLNEFLTRLENLCVKARKKINGFTAGKEYSGIYVNKAVSDIAGDIDVTNEGWLHISLNTLLPSFRHKTSGYITDTIERLISEYKYELPYFEKAFLAIVEHVGYDNHNALDNDNKDWRMIPNVLKGRFIEDDTQFMLSVGLFSELDDETGCEIYLMPFDDIVYFVNQL